MKKTVLLAAAAVAAFTLTTVWLQKQKTVPPAPQPVRAPPEPLENSGPGPENYDFDRVATGYLDAPKVRETQLANKGSPPPPPAAPVEDTATIERKQLAEYVGGISNIEPVSPAQQRAILDSKLRHKKEYEAVLRDSGFERETLSPAERQYAHEAVARALSDYKASYLQDVKPILTDEQFTLLSNYESTEFSRELERLQIQINEK